MVSFELNHLEHRVVSIFFKSISSNFPVPSLIIYRLAIRLEFLGFIVVLTASLVAVLSRGSISPGIAGLSVTYSLTVTTVLSFLVRIYSDYETNVVSVERLLEYTRTPVEPEDEEEPSDPNWPAQGEIIFDNFSARYRPELELVLDRFNLKINPSDRIGLVGRTGAGKCWFCAPMIVTQQMETILFTDI